MPNAPPRIFDRDLYARRRARAAHTAGDLILVRETAEHMAERLTGFGRRFEQALDLTTRDESFRPLQSAALSWIRTTPYSSNHTRADEEQLSFASQSFDLITSVLSLHAVNDLPGTLIQIRRALKPTGLFLGALFAGSTLAELRQAFAAAESDVSGGASPRVAPFADVRDLGALLQRAGFANPVADLERTTVHYRNINRLFADLRALGETNALFGRRKNLLPRRLLEAMRARYAADHSDSRGRLAATFDIVYLTGWA